MLAGAVVSGRDVSADDGCMAVRSAGGKLLDDLAGPGDERGFLEKISRRISAYTELWKENQIGVSPFSAAGEFKYLLSVSAKVANGGIDLGERDLHTSSVATGRAPFGGITLRCNCLPGRESAT